MTRFEENIWAAIDIIADMLMEDYGTEAEAKTEAGLARVEQLRSDVFFDDAAWDLFNKNAWALRQALRVVRERTASIMTGTPYMVTESIDRRSVPSDEHASATTYDARTHDAYVDKLLERGFEPVITFNDHDGVPHDVWFRPSPMYMSWDEVGEWIDKAYDLAREDREPVNILD